MIQTSPLGEMCSQLHALDTLLQGFDPGKEAGSYYSPTDMVGCRSHQQILK